ncbi:WXG100 family type VII secretion target [Amycolatopsis sp. PS_44_ISF1]|uniref:WXG100 family type VII secretion target n=1 Tax=Amycolatopsis sp. PS_44_ISF1 TaxID=2974917 RepID=UPI0028DD4F70|nr:WXG100 family type VII secretion target [Amycolatopsis sp. PS_44_ISF1]MDT8914358.1 WXG100 family type VII secretion target [Amycolatopsis sp. PS_44_ISF1]
MVTTGEYRAEPEAMRSTVGNVGAIIAHGINAVSDLEKLVVQPASFATFGSAVAAAGAALHSRQVTAVRSLLQLLQQINGLVKSSADAYQAADQAVAGGYGSHSAPAPASSSIWGTPHAGELATLAINDSTGAHGEPGSVGNVLRYLGDANFGRLGEHPITGTRFHGVSDFNDWLAGDTGNQARVGLIEVYAGTARTFGDVPGGVHSGDVVVVEPLRSAGSAPVIAVAGDGGALYNHGLVDPGLHGLAKVSVYRPAAVV